MAQSEKELRSVEPSLSHLAARLRRGKPIWLQVKGGSMSPLIRSGDVLEVVPSPRIKPGTIVVVNTPWGVRCHRVVAVQDGQLVLRGDSLEQEEQVLREQVLGKVRTVWRGKQAFSPYEGKWWVYGVLHARTPKFMQVMRKVWRWSRRHKGHRT